MKNELGVGHEDVVSRKRKGIRKVERGEKNLLRKFNGKVVL